MQEVRKEGQVLRNHRAIEPVCPVERGNLHTTRPGPENGSCKAAGDEVLEQEHEHRHAEHDYCSLAEAPQCVADHVRSCPPFELAAWFSPS